MEKLESKLGQSYPGIAQLVRRCLDNAPDQRPSSGEVLSNVSGVKVEVDRVYGGGVLKQLDISKVLVAKEMKRMRKRIQEVQVCCKKYKYVARSTSMLQEVQVCCKKYKYVARSTSMLQEVQVCCKKYKYVARA